MKTSGKPLEKLKEKTMLEPTRVTVQITMTDEITGLRATTQYMLSQAIYYMNGASEFHSQNVGWTYQKLDDAVQEHLKNWKGDNQ